MKTMFILFFGAIGGLLRYFLESAIHLSSGFPLATLIINLTGSFTLGFFYCLAVEKGVSEWLRLGIGIGLIGGFTTFSTMSLELVQLSNHQPELALGYLFSTVLGGLALVHLGDFAAHLVNIPKHKTSDSHNATEAYE